MTFLEEFKMLFKDVMYFFSARKIKEALGVVCEIDRELADKKQLFGSSAWTTAKYEIEKHLILKQKKIVQCIRSGQSTPQEIVYNIVYNVSGDHIQISEYHSLDLEGYIFLNKYIIKRINQSHQIS